MEYYKYNLYLPTIRERYIAVAGMCFGAFMWQVGLTLTGYFKATSFVWLIIFILASGTGFFGYLADLNKDK